MPAKPLHWYNPTGHPQDGDQTEVVAVAYGIGGRYQIANEEGGGYLLWLAHDNFIWEAFATVPEAKARAEVDWQQRYAAQGVSS